MGTCAPGQAGLVTTERSAEPIVGVSICCRDSTAGHVTCAAVSEASTVHGAQTSHRGPCSADPQPSALSSKLQLYRDVCRSPLEGAAQRQYTVLLRGMDMNIQKRMASRAPVPEAAVLLQHGHGGHGQAGGARGVLPVHSLEGPRHVWGAGRRAAPEWARGSQ